MSETANYGLQLTDSDQETFLNWREKLSGQNNSNMQKIDKALGEKADHSIAVSAILLANAWAGVDAPFTQTMNIEGIHEAAKQNGQIYVSQEATFEQRDIARCAMLAVIGQTEGQLVIAAVGEMPEQDIPVTIILLD